MRTVDSPTHKFSFLFSTLTNSWNFFLAQPATFSNRIPFIRPLPLTFCPSLYLWGSALFAIRPRSQLLTPLLSGLHTKIQLFFLKLFSMPSSNQPSVYQPQHNLLDPNQLGVKQALALAEFQKRSTLLALPPFSWSSSLLTCLLCVAQPATNYFLLQWHVHESRPWGLRT